MGSRHSKEDEDSEENEENEEEEENEENEQEDEEEDEEEEEPMVTDDGAHGRRGKSSTPSDGDDSDDNKDVDEDDSGSVSQSNGKDDVRCGQKSDLNAPKRAMSAYNCFVKQRMAERGGKGKKRTGGNTRRMPSLADQWREMTDDDRAPYVKAAAADKQRYDKEKAQYEDDKKQVIKRPVNGYIVFMREFRKKHKGSYKDGKELVREGSKAWKRLKWDQKQPYNSQSLADSDRYAQEKYYHCNKRVRPRGTDTRFSKKEKAEAEAAAAQENAPIEMDASDAEELRDWLKKTRPKPSSSSSSLPPTKRRHKKS